MVQDDSSPHLNLNAQGSLLKDCHRNWVETFEWLAYAVPNGTVESVGGLTIVRSGLPDADFNVAFAFDRPTSLRDAAESIERLMIRTNTPWELVTVSENLEALSPLINELGLVKTNVEPGLVLDPLPDSFPSPPKDLEIRLVRDIQEIRTFLRTGDAGFGAPPGSSDILVDGLSTAIKDGSSQGGYYLGYLDGRPVGTSIRFTTRKIAGIYFVSTLPGFRRRGIGEALTWRAVMDGRKKGCTASFLQASEMGRPVYEKMGFRTIVEYQVWKIPAVQESKK